MKLLALALICLHAYSLPDALAQPSSYPTPFNTYDPVHQKPVSLNDSGVTIILQQGDPQNYFTDPDKLIVSTPSETSTISLPGDIGQVDSISRLGDSQVAVLGMVNGSVSEVVVVNWKTGLIVDEFLCYLPAVSPDGQKIAFIKFYPPHGNEFPPTDHFMVYEPAKGPGSNRPIDVATRDHINVGTTIYPPNERNHESDNVGRFAGETYAAASRLYWTVNGKSLLFGVRSGTEFSIVWVTFPSTGSPEVKIDDLGTSHLCSTPQPACLVVGSDIDAGGDDGPVSVRLTSVAGKTELRRLPASEFLSVNPSR